MDAIVTVVPPKPPRASRRSVAVALFTPEPSNTTSNQTESAVALEEEEQEDEEATSSAKNEEDTNTPKNDKETTLNHDSQVADLETLIVPNIDYSKRSIEFDYQDSAEQSNLSELQNTSESSQTTLLGRSRSRFNKFRSKTDISGSIDASEKLKSESDISGTFPLSETNDTPLPSPPVVRSSTDSTKEKRPLPPRPVEAPSRPPAFVSTSLSKQTSNTILVQLQNETKPPSPATNEPKVARKKSLTQWIFGDSTSLVSSFLPQKPVGVIHTPASQPGVLSPNRPARSNKGLDAVLFTSNVVNQTTEDSASSISASPLQSETKDTDSINIDESVMVETRLSKPPSPPLARSGSLTTPPSSNFAMRELPQIPSAPESPVVIEQAVVDPNAWRAKRINIVNELVETERSYYQDLDVLLEAYIEPCRTTSLLSKHDVLVLFSNIEELILLSHELIELLEAAAATALEEQAIGQCFLDMSKRLNRAYTIYCKSQDNGSKLMMDLKHKPEANQFFDECQQRVADRSNAWDLGAFLIKPVQRLLKYPLLLRDLLIKGTPALHPDRKALEEAIVAMADVATLINESRRRKDLVVKIVGDQFQLQDQVSKLLRGQTTSKKYARVAQKLSQATGLTNTYVADPTFDELNMRLEDSEKLLKALIKDFRVYMQNIRDYSQHELEIALHLEELFFTFGNSSAQLGPILNFKQIARGILTFNLPNYCDKIDQFVLKPLLSLLEGYAGPATVAKKRQRKRLDYDRCRDIEARGEKPDKQLKDSADTYTAINQQLVEELPRFLTLSSLIVDLCTSQFVCLEADYLKDIVQVIRDFAKAVYSEEWLLSALGDIQNTFLDKSLAACVPLTELALLSNWNKARIKLSDITLRRSSDPLQDQMRSRTRQPSKPTLQPNTADSDNLKSISHSSIHYQRVGLILDAEVDFDASQPDELSIKAGDRLVVLIPPSGTSQHENEENWYFAKTVVGDYVGHQGWVPASHLTIVPSI